MTSRDLTEADVLDAIDFYAQPLLTFDEILARLTAGVPDAADPFALERLLPAMCEAGVLRRVERDGRGYYRRKIKPTALDAILALEAAAKGGLLRIAGQALGVLPDIAGTAPEKVARLHRVAGVVDADPHVARLLVHIDNATRHHASALAADDQAIVAVQTELTAARAEVEHVSE